MQKLKKLSLYVVGLLFISYAAHAQLAPEKVIQKTVNQLVDSFTSQRSEFNKDRTKLYAMVEEVVVPLFDMERIAKLVLSKNWKKTNSKQRKEFTEGFKTLLIRSYAVALFKYTGKEKIEFIRTNIRQKNGREFATVKSKFSLGEGPPIPVDYSLMKQADGNWKIYNLTIDGLNMVINYRKSYANIIKNKGIDGLILLLQQKIASTNDNNKS